MRKSFSVWCKLIGVRKRKLDQMFIRKEDHKVYSFIHAINITAYLLGIVPSLRGTIVNKVPAFMELIF